MIAFSTTPMITTSVVNNQPTVTLSASVTDTALTYVSATINWGDGTQQTFSQVPKPLNISQTHTYNSPGNFVITVLAGNFSSPTPQTTTWSGVASYANAGYPVVSASATPSYAYIGPIMANAVGYPNPNQWAWQFGTDNATLVSSLTLLLSTARGERLMDPNYGTNLRQLIFSLSGPIVNDAIYSDVQQAVATYEPSAQLADLASTISGRIITVNADFQSLINGQAFSLPSLNITA